MLDLDALDRLGSWISEVREADSTAAERAADRLQSAHETLIKSEETIRQARAVCVSARKKFEAVA